MWQLTVGVVMFVACGSPTAVPIDAAPIDAALSAWLAVQPAAVDFGMATIGIPGVENQITVTNTGVAPTSAISTARGGANPMEFTVASACTQLAPGAQCTIAVHFAPTSSGSKSAELAIAAVQGGTVNVVLVGVGHTNEGPIVSPVLHDFDDIQVGATSGAQVFTVTNVGGVTFGAATVTPSMDAGQFSMVDGCTGVTLAPAATCMVSIAFAPSAAGAYHVEYDFAATPGGRVALSAIGTGHDPDLVITPNPVDFGVVSSSCGPQTKTVTVTNNAIATTAPLFATIVGGDFTLPVDGCSGTTLAPSQSCTLGVRFSPMSVGAKVDSLHVSAGVATLIGTAATGSAFDVYPAQVDFGAVAPGTTSSSTPITVTNNGPCTLGPLAVQLVGSAASQFAISADACTGTALASGASCTLGVAYAPSVSGMKTASLSLVATPGGSPTVVLTGQ